MSRHPLVVILLMAVSAASCISMRPLSPETRFDGQLARDLRLVLAAPCDFRPGLSLMTDTLASGSYSPLLEDDGGIYFQGSEKVFTRSLVGILSIRDGGIYVSHDHEKIWVFFINNDGNMERYNLPDDCKYRIERCPDCEAVASEG